MRFSTDDDVVESSQDLVTPIFTLHHTPIKTFLQRFLNCIIKIDQTFHSALYSYVLFMVSALPGPEAEYLRQSLARHFLLTKPTPQLAEQEQPTGKSLPRIVSRNCSNSPFTICDLIFRGQRGRHSVVLRPLTATLVAYLYLYIGPEGYW